MVDRQLILDRLAVICTKCTKCSLGAIPIRHQYQDYDQHLPGWFDGPSPMPPVMIVLYRPSWDDVINQKPLSGQAGKLFDRTLHEYGGKYGYDKYRHKFYITNIIKCYGDGDPIKQCSPYLRSEIEIIKPMFVVTLGEQVFDHFCPGLDFASSLGKISKSIVYGVKVYPTYFPSTVEMKNKHKSDNFNKAIRMTCEILFNDECPF